MKCPMCGLEFKKSVKVYRKFYFKTKDREIKVAYRERHCPYCGYTLSTKKVDYDSVKTETLTEKYFKILDTIRRIEDKISKIFDEIVDMAIEW